MTVQREIENRSAFQTKYGHFTPDGMEYVITRHDTPRPWVNVLCNQEPGYGMIVSQTGSGYSWLRNAELNRLTRWEQDLIQDNRGKYVYLRDRSTGEYWSATFQPLANTLDEYECRHGIGYTSISSSKSRIRSRITYFVPPNEPLEVWLVEVQNTSKHPRSLSLITYLEWCLGTAHDSHREFHKTFIETEFERESSTILARKRLWAIRNSKGQGWNVNWHGTAFHACSEPISAYECDKESFVGMYRTPANPIALESGELTCRSGKWGDGIASLSVDLDLPPGSTRIVAFVVGAADSDDEALRLSSLYSDAEDALAALTATKRWWINQLSGFEIHTPEQDLNLLSNVWLRYQTMAGRIWGRSGYYQPGGAYGFRDQLQDSQLFLPTHPELTKRQIMLHAAHQFHAGHVYHWWQPITEEGVPSRFSDDLLWLPFVVSSYLKETADRSILDEQSPYVDAEPESLVMHCFRAIDLSLSRFSSRGLPLIGEGDWNDGLSAVGFDGKGESVWVGHFLCYLLPEWAKVAARVGDHARADAYRTRADELRLAINREAWDGEWYIRATRDDGQALGSRECREGRIFLNAQTWALISGTCPADRQMSLMRKTREMLYTDAGPSLLRPAYTQPDEHIGYITRYAPGTRENGGVYLHAATWAIWAECLLGEADHAWSIYEGISPVLRAIDPDGYKSEPYVTAGNIDGPDSPNAGTGGWTWYSGSAAWLFKVMTERVLGIRPEESGLRIDPCIPAHWPEFTMTRSFRGCTYKITVCNPRRVTGGVSSMKIDGLEVDGSLVPPFGDSAEHIVEVELG